MDTAADSDDVLLRFNRMMRELRRGRTIRTTFQPWEVELLLDIEACNIRQSSTRYKTFRRYQETVQRQLEKGAGKPMKLSEFLAQRKR